MYVLYILYYEVVEVGGVKAVEGPAFPVKYSVFRFYP